MDRRATAAAKYKARQAMDQLFRQVFRQLADEREAALQEADVMIDAAAAEGKKVRAVTFPGANVTFGTPHIEAEEG
jgi:hypothetical protein